MRSSLYGAGELVVLVSFSLSLSLSLSTMSFLLLHRQFPLSMVITEPGILRFTGELMVARVYGHRCLNACMQLACLFHLSSLRVYLYDIVGYRWCRYKIWRATMSDKRDLRSRVEITSGIELCVVSALLVEVCGFYRRLLTICDIFQVSFRLVRVHVVNHWRQVDIAWFFRSFNILEAN